MTQPQPIRVLIADDEAHIRNVVAAITGALGGKVVAEAADGETAFQLFLETRPDMVILDINMPRAMGDEALKRILEVDPDVFAVMMSAQDTIDTVRRCLDVGARNYILKNNSAEEIYRLLSESWALYAAETREREAA
jgi:two-component system, chemotaxis family, chemotaxis protein CheY